MSNQNTTSPPQSPTEEEMVRELKTDLDIEIFDTEVMVSTPEIAKSLYAAGWRNVK